MNEFGDGILLKSQPCLDLLKKLEEVKPKTLECLSTFLEKASPNMSISDLAKLIKATIKNQSQLNSLTHFWQTLEKFLKQLTKSSTLTAKSAKL